MNSAATIRSSLQTWVEITRFGQQACAPLNLDRVEETILGCVPRLIGTDALGLYLLDERHMPVRVTRVGASDALVHDMESLGRGSDPFLKRLLQTRKPLTTASCTAMPAGSGNHPTAVSSRRTASHTA